MRHKQKKQAKNKPILVSYFATIALFLFAAFFPHTRVWGVNWWAFFPVIVPILMALAFTLLGSFAYRRFSKSEFTSDSSSGREDKTRYWMISGSISMLILIGLFLMPARTHFLGDGYQLLSRLTDNVQSVKAWDFGASMVHNFLYSILPESSPDRALRTYRLFSQLCGGLLLLSVLIYARKRFDDLTRQLLLFGGLASGGYMLLFFGYVENYAGLALAVMLFALSGDLNIRGRLGLIGPIAATLLALFFHLFGIFLLPAMLYLLLRSTGTARRVQSLSKRSIRMTLVLLLVLGLVAHYFLRSSSLFLTFAFLPLVPDRFAVDSDYIFSIKHLLDLLNLLLILMPGLILALVGVGRRGFVRANADNSHTFWAILLVSLLLPPLFLNAGIGMPRNWDLFSLVGIPLVLGLLTSLLDAVSSRGQKIAAVALVILLGVAMLVPRVVVQFQPEMGIAHFENYLDLDRTRNRNARSLLMDYYLKAGDTTAAENVHIATVKEFPEINLNERAEQLMLNGRYREAAAGYERVIKLNPLQAEAYANLGNCMLLTGKNDSALQLLRLADGINPYNLNTVTSLGTALLRSGKIEEAKKSFDQAYRIDSLSRNVLVGLASTHLQLGAPERSIEYVRRLSEFDDMPYSYFQQAGESYLAARAYAEAYEALEMARSHGLDSTIYNAILRSNPALGKQD
ncbi:MAG: tetratricopeptide repeat protein [bacterium]|nr:tetratricopeptide repeat protein [bacterium]